MKYKFKINDKVRIIDYGRGLGSEELNKIVTIIELGIYDDSPGYRIDPPLGNSLRDEYDYMIGEESFELVRRCDFEF